MNSQRVRGATELDTYWAASVTFSATASATDIFVIGGTNNKRLVTPLRIVLSATSTTATSVGDWRLEKRSTANTGGTAASMTAVPSDSGQIAAQALVQNYTANPVQGSIVGVVWQPRVIVSPAIPTTNPIVLDWDLTQLLNARPIRLRSAAEQLALSFNGVALPGGLANVQVSVLWTEEKL